MSFSFEELCKLAQVKCDRAIETETEGRDSTSDENLWSKKNRVKSATAKDANFSATLSYVSIAFREQNLFLFLIFRFTRK